MRREEGQGSPLQEGWLCSEWSQGWASCLCSHSDTRALCLDSLHAREAGQDRKATFFPGGAPLVTCPNVPRLCHSGDGI